jgi:hypothetical protein
LRATNDVVGNYLQTVGTIYAVLMAFVVFVVWGQFNDARSYVEREANELCDLFRIAKGLPEHTQSAIADSLRRYCAAVLDEEWYAMSKNDQPAMDRVATLLEGTWQAIHVCEPLTECQKALHAEAMARFNDLSDLRTFRLTSARLRIPVGLRILLYSGAKITVLSMCLFAVEHFWVHALITAMLAGAIAHVLYIIADLDNCFAGDWVVPREAFERAQRFMALR